MIDLKSETIVPFVELPALMKKRGRPITLQSLYRWKLKGLQGVQLEVVYKDGKPYTSTEALDRFNLAVTEAKSRRVVLQLPSVSTTKQASKAHERAKKKLAAKRKKID